MRPQLFYVKPNSSIYSLLFIWYTQRLNGLCTDPQTSLFLATSSGISKATPSWLRHNLSKKSSSHWDMFKTSPWKGIHTRCTKPCETTSLDVALSWIQKFLSLFWSVNPATLWSNIPGAASGECIFSVSTLYSKQCRKIWRGVRWNHFKTVFLSELM